MKSKETTFVLGLLLVAALLVVTGSLPWNERAQATSAGERTISTYGEAVVAVSPDKATINFGVESEGKTAQEAVQANATQMEKVVTSLKSQGIAANSIQTSGYNLNPDYDYSKDTRRLRGYRVSNTVQVETTDLAGLGKLIDTTVTAGANIVHGVAFGVKDTAQLESEALEAAVKQARAKAEPLAKAAGTTINGVISIEEISNSGFQPLMMDVGMKRMAAETNTLIEPGQVNLMTQVRVVFSH